MTDDEVYDKLMILFKGERLSLRWAIHPQDTPEEIKKRHGDTPLQQLRTMMILTASHHLTDDSPGELKHELWSPRRPVVGKRLLDEALKLPIPGYKKDGMVLP
ncbi:MAG: hypothetical protein NTX59_12865 [Elusimicrobia bacterium]|nr:hypothetical protein [Elusimicrobiota bacterium]